MASSADSNVGSRSYSGWSEALFRRPPDFAVTFRDARSDKWNLAMTRSRTIGKTCGKYIPSLTISPRYSYALAFLKALLPSTSGVP